MSNDEEDNGFNFLNININDELKDDEDNKNENEEINKPIIKNDLKIKGFRMIKKRKNEDQNGEREYINNGNTDQESIKEIFETDEEEANISTKSNNNNKKRKNRESSTSPTASPKNNAKRTKSKNIKEDENSNDEENNEKKENGIHYGEEDMVDEVNGEEKKKMINTIYLKLKKMEQEMARDREEEGEDEDEWLGEKEYSVGTNNMAMALSAWIDGNNKKIRKEIEEKNNLNNSNNMTNLMSIDELTIRLKSVCKDERFSSGDNIAESLTTTMQTSLSINLHPHHFSIGNNITAIYPYDRNSRNFIEMINANKISVEFLDIIRENGSVHYYEGCVLIELRDYRDKSSSGQPVVKKVLLRPTYETVVHDITVFCNSKDKFSEGDRLQLESSLVLNTAKPLCLDPSPNVFYINTIINYNKHKNNIKLSKDERVKLLRSNENPSPSNYTIPQTVFPKKKIPLFEFLSQRQNTPLIPKETNGGGGGGLAFSLSFGTVGNVPQMPESNFSSFQNVNIQDLVPMVLPNHEMSFSKPNGNIFFYFKLSDLPSGQFQGLIRVGDNPDKGDNGYKYKFNTGNKKSTENFVKQMVNCFIKDGYSITHDSSRQRRPYNYSNSNNNLNNNNNNNLNSNLNNNISSNINNNNNLVNNLNSNNNLSLGNNVNNIQGNMQNNMIIMNPNNNPNNPNNINSNMGSLNNISFNNGMGGGLNNSQGINLNNSQNLNLNNNMNNMNNPNMMETQQEFPKYPNAPNPPRVTKILNQQPTKHPPFNNSYNHPRSNSFDKKI